METSGQGTIIGAMNKPMIGATYGVDSVHNHLERMVGERVTKTITLAADNTTASVNIFKVVGSVQIYRMWGCIATATTLTDCDSASWDLFTAGDAAVQITAAGGDIGGMAVGTCFFKDGLAANNFSVNDNSTCALTEQTYEGSDVFSRFIVTQKTGADTYIRFTYTTTDAPIAATLDMAVEWHAMNGASSLVAA